jgi:hypothetical protein
MFSSAEIVLATVFSFVTMFSSAEIVLATVFSFVTMFSSAEIVLATVFLFVTMFSSAEIVLATVFSFVGNDQQIIRNLSLQDVVNSGNTTDVVNITNNTSANIDDETVLVTTATNGNTLISLQTISSHENNVTNESTVASTISLYRW